MNDPIEDNPNHSWTDYRKNWESTLVASLLQPHVWSYEILPWPDRIFGPKGLYPLTEPTASEPKPQRAAISGEYQTELQAVFHALGEMKQPEAHWERAGTEGVGVLVSDTMMFQRAQPQPSDEDLGSFYGLALPLLMRGVPVEPVQIESAYTGDGAAKFLANYKVLLLTYEGQKPPSPKFHEAIAAWVKAGGALVVVDNDGDPYNHATDWWSSGGMQLATPREDLFRVLGLNATAEGLHRVGKAQVIAASGKVSDVSTGAHAITFSIAAIEGRGDEDRIAIRMIVPKTPSKVLVEDQPVQTDSWHHSDGMLLLELPAHAKAQKISVSF